jgi:delta(3,5)-delta(2,4)-dienoyl-CoA isomerase
MFSTQEAEKLGLVSKVVPGGRAEVVAAALDLASLIAQKSPIAVSGTKRILLHSRDHTYAFNLHVNSDLMSALQSCRELGIYCGMEFCSTTDTGRYRCILF